MPKKPNKKEAAAAAKKKREEKKKAAEAVEDELNSKEGVLRCGVVAWLGRKVNIPTVLLTALLQDCRHLRHPDL